MSDTPPDPQRDPILWFVAMFELWVVLSILFSFSLLIAYSIATAGTMTPSVVSVLALLGMLTALVAVAIVTKLLL